MQMLWCTVKPPDKGHTGDNINSAVCVLCREVAFFSVHMVTSYLRLEFCIKPNFSPAMATKAKLQMQYLELQTPSVQQNQLHTLLEL